MHYQLLDAFQGTFLGRKYIHRNQGIGNFIASHLYEDMLTLGRSQRFVAGAQAGRDVVNTLNHVTGRKGRRGDGTLGELIPGEHARSEPGFTVLRGPVATLEVGAEVKILAKSMIKQIDRVINDLRGQALTFNDQTDRAITVGIVGVNFSDVYTSYEGDRAYPAEVPPSREAPTAIRRIMQTAARGFDELLLLPFRVTNVEPFPFHWVNEAETRKTYSAALLRISNLFQSRF